MKKQWLAQCMRLAGQEADFWSGARKIIRGVHFSLPNLNNDMGIADCGFTKSKLTILRKHYLHVESHDMAQTLWERRCSQEKYGSVGFSCYNHLLKGNIEKKSKRASVMGPCIQAVNLTWLNKQEMEVDVFYRTTELFKKFPADLVFLRDELLAPFDTSNLASVNFHFANVTLHPMYFVTILPLLPDPIKSLDEVKRHDRRFFDWAVKWTSRYLCPEHFRGIEKFAQAMRVRKDALERLDPKMRNKLERYLKENHPGYRKDYVDPDGDDDEEV